jgi:hypothetical protein
MEDLDKTLFRMQITALVFALLAWLITDSQILSPLLGLLSISLGVGRSFYIKNKSAGTIVFVISSLCWVFQFTILAYSMR